MKVVGFGASRRDFDQTPPRALVGAQLPELSRFTKALTAASETDVRSMVEDLSLRVGGLALAYRMGAPPDPLELEELELYTRGMRLHFDDLGRIERTAAALTAAFAEPA